MHVLSPPARALLRRLALAAACAGLTACSAVEMLASGVSDGTKYVIKQVDGTNAKPAPAPTTGQSPQTTSAGGTTPLASPTVPVTKGVPTN